MGERYFKRLSKTPKVRSTPIEFWHRRVDCVLANWFKKRLDFISMTLVAFRHSIISHWWIFSFLFLGMAEDQS